ncbi:DUF960 family protein [Salimicrobium flavidum]|uniref:DUF960 domain-containing protein n=1 Tax=Salimicrobium flavidum TaxID=570947 RepID=A0A1N7IWP1_9BACI|nr:DUF960 family protein [Salimicrobium flavidum]SIS41505.1 protein of unknown function [Salimicrobium flavidum]
MFEPIKPKYMTKRVADELNVELLGWIVHYLDVHFEKLSDYLQVFEFYVEGSEQWVVQKQEVPDRKTTIKVEIDGKPLKRTVWTLDQEDHVMILFPSDY